MASADPSVKMGASQASAVSGPTPESSRPALPSVLGDCAIRLSHATSYEPPLYLFPQLLPQVPQGSAPIMVWDAVAGAIDVASSYWHMADASSLLASVGHGNKRTRPDTSSTKPAVTTLASLLSSNKLVPLGLHASVLANGSFSAASMMQELATLQERAGLSDEEAAVLMSNHFVNLLAWKKLREINDPAPLGTLKHCGVADKADQSADEGSVSATPTTTGKNATAASRKRLRASHAEDDRAETEAEDGSPSADAVDVLARLRASPDPWTDVVNDPKLGGTFVAGQEKDVEKRVELLRTLSALYRKPWRQLRSQGVQTDFVVPPGTVNTTSPYADHHHVAGAHLQPETELGWSSTAASMQPCTLRARTTPPKVEGDRAVAAEADEEVPAVAPFHVLVSGAGAGTETGTPFALVASSTYFGHTAGPQRTAAMGSVHIDVGLAPHTRRPELLAPLQFALMLKPVFGARVPRPHGASGDDGTEKKPASLDRAENDGDEETEAPGGATSPASPTSEAAGARTLHTKTPTAYKLFLVNYGRNGVRVVGRQWCLGDVVELVDGDELRVGADSVSVKITAAHTSQTMGVGDEVKPDPGLTPIKREEPAE